MTSTATHACCRCWPATPAGASQVASGVASHERRFGDLAGGFWLPECAYEPGLERDLAATTAPRASASTQTARFGLGSRDHLSRCHRGRALAVPSMADDGSSGATWATRRMRPLPRLPPPHAHHQARGATTAAPTTTRRRSRSRASTPATSCARRRAPDAPRGRARRPGGGPSVRARHRADRPLVVRGASPFSPRSGAVLRPPARPRHAARRARRLRAGRASGLAASHAGASPGDLQTWDRRRGGGARVRGALRRAGTLRGGRRRRPAPRSSGRRASSWRSSRATGRSSSAAAGRRLPARAPSGPPGGARRGLGRARRAWAAHEAALRNLAPELDLSPLVAP